MNEVTLKVNAAVVANNRRALANVGKSFGLQFFRATQEDTNLRHNEEVVNSENNNNLDLVLNRSPRRFKLTGTDIVAVEVGEQADGASVVYINRGRKKQVGDKVFSQEAIIPITGDMRIDSDASDDAILAQALAGDRSKIFADPDALLDKLNALNDNEIIRVDKAIEKLQLWKKMIIDTKNSNIDKARKFKAERTKNSVESVQATIVED